MHETWPAHRSCLSISNEFDACGVTSLQDFFIGDIFLPLNAHDGFEASLLKPFQQFHLVVTVAL